MSVANRLNELSAHVAAARRDERERCERVLGALGRSVAVARAVPRELDRRLARRFNALDYLRTDELGLSRIVADLLDPRGAHGQGTCFLARFLELVGPDRLPEEAAAALAGGAVTVEKERVIDDERRLDISAEIRARGREPFCIAVENKPYAADGKAQIADYLRFLRRCYGTRFLLVYLSPGGGRPSEEALPRGAREDGLATLSYCRRAGSGDALRLPFSLADWLRECRERCEAERLRWFLREVETFCHKTFGGTAAMSEEKKAIRDFILSSDENARTVAAVLDVWPKVRDDAIRRFLETLCGRIDESLRGPAGMGGFQVQRGTRWSKKKAGVTAFRTNWPQVNGQHPDVGLWSDYHAKGWYMGVHFRPGNGGADLREQLATRLCNDMQDGTRGHNVVWYRYVDDYRDWSPLIARLHRESSEPGKMIAYFTAQFVDMAKKAAPIVEDVLAGRE